MTRPRDADITEREKLADRIRALLADEPSLDERSMFGSRAFMVREKLVACAFKQGRLLIRVDAQREDELLERPGATRAVMAGRDMGPGWVSVAPDAIGGDRDLRFWLDVALNYNRFQTGDLDRLAERFGDLENSEAMRQAWSKHADAAPVRGCPRDR